MSVSFVNSSVPVRWTDEGEPLNPEAYLNVSNANAKELLDWLDIYRTDNGLIGDIPAKTLAAKCRRRLWPEPRNLDPFKPGKHTKRPGHGAVIEMPREEGYLQGRTKRLLELCELDLKGTIFFD
jgi:hypothetical protein